MKAIRQTALAPLASVGTKPAAIYARVSTDGQVGGRFDSCDSQAAVCREVIEANATKGWYEVACLTDAAYSGGTMNRPGIQALKRMIEAGEVKVVVVFKLERLSRNLDEWGPFREFLHSHGCELVSATEDISESEPEGRLKNNILLSVSDYERRNTAKKVRIKMREQAKRGFWNGGMVPLGYDYDKNTQRLQPNPAESVVVRRIFERAAELVSLTEIANLLNQEGVRTKSRLYTRRNGSQVEIGRGAFRSDGVRLVVQNPIYRGCVRFEREDYKGQHEALVSDALWDRANAAINRPETPEHRQNLARNKHQHLLKGIAWCGHCGRSMVPAATNKLDAAGQPYRYYNCGSIHRAKHGHNCPVGRIAAGALERVVLEFLAEVSHHPEVTRLALTSSRHTQQTDRGALEAELARREKELAEINRQLRNYADAIVAGGAELLGEELKAQASALRNRKHETIVAAERARQRLRACTEEQLDERIIVRSVERLGQILPELDAREQREFMELFVARLEIRSARLKDHATAPRPVSLTFKFDLPQLVDGMEERVLVGRPEVRPLQTRQRTLTLELKATIAGQGAQEASAIRAPFMHAVTSPERTHRAAEPKARHPIHRALRWERMMERDPSLEKQGIALREGLAPGSVTHHFKMLQLPDAIRDYLVALDDPIAIRFLSLRKMHRLADVPAPKQLAQFDQLRETVSRITVG